MNMLWETRFDDRNLGKMGPEATTILRFTFANYYWNFKLIESRCIQIELLVLNIRHIKEKKV